MDRRLWIRNIAVALALWVGGATLGFGVATQVAPKTVEALPKAATATTANASGPTGRELYFGILGRNLAVYAWLLCGVVSLGISTVAVTLFNGVHLGQTIALAAATGTSATSVAWLILPHGVLEVSAFLVAAALGMLGPRLAHAWLSNDGRFGAKCLQLARLWPIATLGAATLVAAAGVETYVTVPLAGWLGAGR
ncbi:MAG: stage II sporulation protein M [Gammaproteobacteria bacterium]|nr:stage II sporulation protein M [Gammaproteobacteria bacterium]